jgi:hypothetical protein
MNSMTFDQQARVTDSVQRLPPQIGIFSLRDLVPVMAALQVERRLNLLAAEAVAAVLDSSTVSLRRGSARFR